MAKEFTYRGKTLEELQKMELKEFMKLIPSRQRRSLRRGFSPSQQRLLKKIEQANSKQVIKTHHRDMVVIPQMVGSLLHVHRGNAFIPVKIEEEAIGMYLGELVLTRSKVAHSAPGVGATRSSTAISVR